MLFGAALPLSACGGASVDDITDVIDPVPNLGTAPIATISSIFDGSDKGTAEDVKIAFDQEVSHANNATVTFTGAAGTIELTYNGSQYSGDGATGTISTDDDGKTVITVTGIAADTYTVTFSANSISSADDNSKKYANPSTALSVTVEGPLPQAAAIIPSLGAVF